MAVANLAECAHFAQKAAREVFVLAQIVGEELEGPRLVHKCVLREIDRAHTALAELFNDPVVAADEHAGAQIANLTEQAAVDWALGEAVGIAGLALGADLHFIAQLRSREFASQAQSVTELLQPELAVRNEASHSAFACHGKRFRQRCGGQRAENNLEWMEHTDERFHPRLERELS